MLSENPSVVCLCPTYGRPPHLLGNIIQCFLTQTYTGPMYLLISDDLGNLAYDQSMDNVVVVSTDERFASLPAKYNAMRQKAMAADVVVVFEDDDLYLPHHVSSCVNTLRTHEWCHPEKVWSTYTGSPCIEGAAGRFHASLAFRRAFLDRINGWPETDRPDFDQQLLAVAAQNAPCGHPNAGEGEYPSYVFRWSDTLSAHGQGTMGHGADWYRDYRPQFTQTVWIGRDTIGFDAAAQKTIAAIEAMH